MNELDGKIEAILFASADYVPLDKLITLTGESKTNILESIKRIEAKYTESAIQLQEQNNTWKFGIKNPYMPVVQNLIQNTELTKSVMETLAVIAWKSPIVQSDVIKIRTNKAYDHIAELEEKGFVAKEKSGRTYLLKLTQKFNEYFDVSSREQIQQIFEEVDQKPKNKTIVPQRKVIDFDGTPRPAAKLEDVQVQVYDAEQTKQNEEQKKKQDAEQINSMRQAHKSHLEELEQLLAQRAQENKQLVDDIHAQIPQALKVEAPQQTNNDLQEQNTEVADGAKNQEQQNPNSEIKQKVQDHEVLDESSGEHSKRLEDHL